jgi:hypothetical protein
MAVIKSVRYFQGVAIILKVSAAFGDTGGVKVDKIDELIQEADRLLARLKARETTRLIYGKFTIVDQWVMDAANFIQSAGDFKARARFNEAGFHTIKPEPTEDECFEYTCRVVETRRAFLVANKDRFKGLS